MVSKSIFAAQIVRCITASISLIGSSILSLMIIASEKGFKSPYSRIIWGLSLGDILQSLMILLSPFLSPADNPDSIFRMGSVRSCEVLGFFGSIGGTAVPLYTLFLTYYFLRRVKYKVKPEQFAKFEEKLICALILIYSIATNTAALATGHINATNYGSMCMVASRPYDCVSNNAKECTRGEKANLYSLVTPIVPIVISFLCLFVVLGMFTCHVYNIEKLLVVSRQAATSNEQKPLRAKKVNQNQLDANMQVLLEKYKQNKSAEYPFLAEACLAKNGKEESEETVQKFDFILSSSLDDDTPVSLKNDKLQDIDSGDKKSGKSQKDRPQQPAFPTSLDEENAASLRDQLQHNKASEAEKNFKSQKDNTQQHQAQGMSMTKEAGLQSILYILAFMLVYSGPVIALFSRFSKADNTEANYWIISLFLPIGGIFNMLIYTRPKVKALKELIPELSIFMCFVCVIAFGGECPSLVDLQFSSSDENSPVENDNMTRWMKQLGWYVSTNDINIDEKVLKIMKGEPFRREEDNEDTEIPNIERVQSEE